MPEELCRVCGAPLKEGAKFCASCGAKAPDMQENVIPEAAEMTDAVDTDFSDLQNEVPAATAEQPDELNRDTYAPEDTPLSYNQQENDFQPSPPAAEPAAEQYREPVYSGQHSTYNNQPAYQPEKHDTYNREERQSGYAYNPAPPYVPVSFNSGGEQAGHYVSDADSAPGKKSKYANISVAGWIGIFFLMMIPIVNIILIIIWACGGCRKLAKTKFARACLIMVLICLVISIAMALVFRFVAVPKLEENLRQFGVTEITPDTLFDLIEREGFDSVFNAAIGK